MMSLPKHSHCIYILFVCLFYLLSITFNSSAEEKKEIKVGLFQFSPMNFLDSTGEPAGIYVDLIEEIAAKENWLITYVRGTWDEGLNRVKNGEIDLMPSIAFSVDREKLIDFTHEPVVTLWGEVYTRPNSDVQNILDLEGKTVSIMKGDISAINFKKLIDEFKIKCTFIECPSHEIVLQQVDEDKANGGVVPNIFGVSHHQKYNLVKSSIIFSAFSIYFGAPEGKNASLLTTIDYYLKNWKNDKNSFYYNTIDYWLGGEQYKKEIIPRWLLFALAGLVAFALLLIIWVKSLRYQVELRTLKLRESEERFRAIADTSPLAIYMSEGIEQKAVYINPTFTELFGYTIDEVPTVDQWWPLAYPDENYRQQVADEWQKKVQQALDTKTQIEPMEVVVTCKDGSKKNISWGFISTEKQNWACGLDLTDRKQAERDRITLETQLRQSHKMEAIGTLAGGIAHDFNNILAAILGYADMAMDDIPTNSPVKYQIEQILKAGNRAKDLVKHILSFSRKENQARVPVEISNLVREALNFLRASIPTTIRIQENNDIQSANILADATQIHQVIVNLCTNSAHAMDEQGGILEVTLSNQEFSENDLKKESNLTPGKYVRLCVKDSGVGIDQKDLDRIFDPYFTTKGVGKGSGMGLAVVAGIVKSHDGMITVDSKPGDGTIFNVYFPIIEQKIQEKIEDDSPIPTGKESILVVDDEDSLIDVTRKRLERLGYQVTTQTSSIKALEIFRANPGDFDLVISDQTMPELTGEHLANELLVIRPDIPIIICTGYSSKMDAEKARSRGITAFIMKPVDKTELAKTIRDALDSR